MSENEKKAESLPEWMTLPEAAKHPSCDVSRQALWSMIQREEVPADCVERRPYGKRTIYYIDGRCLPALNYRYHGQRGRGKKNL